MLTFLQALFISVIILHQANIWITFLPSPSMNFIVVAICLLAATADNHFPAKGFHRTLFLSVFGLAVALFGQIAFDPGGVSGNRGFASVIAYVTLTVLSLILVFRWKRRQEIYATRVFIIVCSLMSLLGFVAWLIVNFTWGTQELIDPAYLVDVSQFTDGKVGRIDREYFETANEFGIFENTYSFPYYMGLVLTNSYLYELFGFQFFRASSWYTEPVSVWYMVIPAIVLTFSGSYFSRNARIILLAIQGCFLFASFSLSIIIALIVGYMLRTLLRAFGPDAGPRGRFKAGVVILSVIAALSLFGMYALEFTPGTELARNIIVDKIFLGDTLTLTLESAVNPVFVVCYLFFLLVTLACCWRAARANDRELMSFSLVVFCFLIVALKGALYHLILSPAFFIFYFLMLKHFDLSRAARFQKVPLAVPQAA